VYQSFVVMLFVWGLIATKIILGHDYELGDVWLSLLCSWLTSVRRYGVVEESLRSIKRSSEDNNTKFQALLCLPWFPLLRQVAKVGDRLCMNLKWSRGIWYTPRYDGLPTSMVISITKLLGWMRAEMIMDTIRADQWQYRGNIHHEAPLRDC
jgi:hypothetical protein